MTRTLNQKGVEAAAGEIHLATGEKMEWARPIARSAIAAYLDEVEREAAASDPAPTGWRLVPIEPTKRMLIDGVCALAQFQVIGSRIGFSNIGDTYRAMIDAAPEPPAPVQSDYAIEAAHKILGNRQRSAALRETLEQVNEALNDSRIGYAMALIDDALKSAPKGRDE